MAASTCLDPSGPLDPLLPLQLVHLDEEVVGGAAPYIVLAFKEGQFIIIIYLKGQWQALQSEICDKCCQGIKKKS